MKKLTALFLCLVLCLSCVAALASCDKVPGTNEETTAGSAATTAPEANVTEEPTDAPETNAPETNAPEQGGDATQAPESETDAPKEGCGSVIGFSVVAILAAAAAAVALKKKD